MKIVTLSVDSIDAQATEARKGDVICRDFVEGKDGGEFSTAWPRHRVLRHIAKGRAVVSSESDPTNGVSALEDGEVKGKGKGKDKK
ncbi:MAG: hypothetical protein IIC82_03390 [Chloroflexi bacterium]|nr:hypothetical protein [Chloroflexota bacterium]